MVSVATGAYSATTQGDQSSSKADQSQARKSLEALFGKTFISIDGSTIRITAAEGRLSREIVAPNGAVQRSNFVFLNARLGTVTDSRDAARLSGVFRASDQEILVQFGDGSSELVLPNSSGGITIETITPRNPSYCTSWYPEGHVFSLEDRKAALAQYANRLGLGVSTEKAAGPPARSSCDDAAASVTPASSTPAVPAASPVPAAAPTPAASPVGEAAPTPAPAAPAAAQAAQKAASAAQPLPAGSAAPNVATAASAQVPAAGVESAPPAGALASAPAAAASVASVAASAAQAPAAAAAAALPSIAEATAKAAAKVAELPPTENVAVRQSEIHLIDKAATAAADTTVVAAATPATAATAPAPRGEPGASTCLTVESDGMHWGFRNKCAYSVQFAYCTMDGRNQLTACKDGFVGGSVAANGFGILVADQNLRSVNENHDFRWVACQGGAGEVIARMDKSDPPVGRCMR
ncbi:MAG: hypothetical protein ACREC6_02740 [Hyphomicrobiaceae bacterium]